MIPEHVLVEQLRSIAKREPVFPGDTLSHKAANECGRRGYARRNEDGDWIVTVAGVAYLHSPFVRAADLLPQAQAHVDALHRLLGEVVHVLIEPLVLGQTGSMTAVLAHGPDLLRRIKEATSPPLPKAPGHSTRLTVDPVDSGSKDSAPVDDDGDRS